MLLSLCPCFACSAERTGVEPLLPVAFDGCSVPTVELPLCAECLALFAWPGRGDAVALADDTARVCASIDVTYVCGTARAHRLNNEEQRPTMRDVLRSSIDAAIAAL